MIPIIARSGKGTNELLEAALGIATQKKEWQPISLSYGDDLDKAILDLVEDIESELFLTDTYPARFTALKYLENDEQILAKGERPRCGSCGPVRNPGEQGL